MEKIRSNPTVKLLAKVAVTGVAIWFITQKLDFAAIGDAFRRAELIWIVPALLLFVLSKLLGAYRLQIFWRVIGVRLSDAYNLRLYWLGMFYNFFLPGGIGGDGYKVYLLRKTQDTPVKSLVTTVLLDRVSGLAVLVLLALAVSVAVELPYGLHRWAWALIPVGLGLHALGLRLVFPRHLPTLLPALLWSLGVQGGQAIAAACLCAGLGVESGFAGYVFIFLLSSIVLVVPLPSLGGLGLREAVILLGANELGLDPAVSVSMSLLFYLISALASAGGLYYHLRPAALGPPF
ncbi:MAG: lysylphosphatidylglycerol synthase transmembrane domain-containing protein [Bacteroidota bacterium]